jgi:hypothetical protein
VPEIPLDKDAPEKKGLGPSEEHFLRRGVNMELILIIIVLVLLFGGGGGYWGRRRGFW